MEGICRADNAVLTTTSKAAGNINFPTLRKILGLPLLAVMCLFLIACSDDEDLIPIVVYVEGHSLSKLPFIIARDQGFYRKYGLDLEFQMPPPEFDAGKIPRAPLIRRIMRRLGLEERPSEDIRVTGHTPSMYLQTNFTGSPHRIALAATDCSIRYYFVARPGIDSVDDILGKRVGINAHRTTSAFAIYRLVEMRGWDARHDLSIYTESRGVESLRNGDVDVIIGGDEAFEDANREGFPILLDTRDWNESLAGNSILVEAGWLEQGNNREAARRFVQAFLEGLVIFHEQPQMAIEIAYRWYGHPDLEFAADRYTRTDYVPRIPFPCYEGIANTLRVHDSHAMAQFTVEDFYDDSILQELLDEGFLETLYEQYSD